MRIEYIILKFRPSSAGDLSRTKVNYFIGQILHARKKTQRAASSQKIGSICLHLSAKASAASFLSTPARAHSLSLLIYLLTFHCFSFIALFNPFQSISIHLPTAFDHSLPLWTPLAPFTSSQACNTFIRRRLHRGNMPFPSQPSLLILVLRVSQC